MEMLAGKWLNANVSCGKQQIWVIAAFELSTLSKMVADCIHYDPGAPKRKRVDRKDQRDSSAICDVCYLPDDPRVRPASDGAVQSHTLLLPNSVGARFDHKLWGVHQAVFVHALKVFLVFMDLQEGQH